MPLRPLTLLLLLLTSSALAQVPREVWNWWDKDVVKDLKLTDPQRDQIRRTVREYRNRLIDQRAAAQKAEADLGDCFNEDAFDARKTNEAIERMVTARATLTRTLTQMAAQLRSVLTPEQWRELERRRPGRVLPADGPGGARRRLRQGLPPAPRGPAQ
jgi:Spy/CpxP family protein refolding chaperone